VTRHPRKRLPFMRSSVARGLNCARWRTCEPGREEMPSRVSIVAAVAATLIMTPVLASAQGPGGGGGAPGPAGPGIGGGRGPVPRQPVLASAAPDPAMSAATSPSIATSISTAADRVDRWSAGAITAASGTAPDRASGAANGSPTAWGRAGRGRRSAMSGCAADALTARAALPLSLPVPAPAAGGRGCGNAITGVTVEPGARDGGPP
jgi:hypothetical protein